jgi:class 3 adenylate cyclase
MEAGTVPTSPDVAAAQTTHEVAMLLFELRREPRPSSRITPEVAEMIVNRCVIAALEVLTAAGAEVSMSGTEVRPVVEARFDGAQSPARAAHSACEILASVRRVQRAAENEFQVVGAITAGVAGPGPGGVTMTVGGPDVLLHRLREAAAPGQILLSEAARAACEGLVETLPLRTAGDGSIEAHLLRRIRPPRMEYSQAPNRGDLDPAR